MDGVTLLGMTAGTLTTFALLPQVVRIVRTRSADDVSTWTFAVMAVGILLWTAYGALLGSLPVVIFNSITFVLALVILGLKARYRR